MSIVLPSFSGFASPAFSSAFNSTSLQFDGTDDFAQTSSVSLVAKTISVWIKPDSTINASSSRECLLGFGTAEQGIYLGGENSQLTNEIIQITDGYGSWGYESASASISSSAWHHICCVWETSNSSTNSGNPGYDIYLNATKVGNGFGNYGLYGNRNYITTETVKQGAFARTSGGTPCFYDGLQDEVAIWNASLSAADITKIYNFGAPNDLTEAASYDTDRTGNLIGYWRNGDGTEGGSGTTVYDMSSNSNNMTLTNGPAYSDSVPVAPFSTLSSRLDGANDYLATTFDPSSIGTGNYSVSLWFNIDSGASEDHPYFFAFGANSSGTTNTYQGLGLTGRSGNGYKVRINNYFSSYTQSVSSSTSDVVAGSWYNFVLVRDGTSLTLYKNGSSFLTLTNANVGSNDFSQGSELRLGYGYGAASRYIDGLMDEVAIFNSALSASDVTAIYNNGVPADLASLSPLSWWRMGENDSGSDGATIGTVTDQGSGGNNATGTNGPTYSNSVPVAPFSTLSASFDGTDDLLNCGDDSSLEPANVTISAWFKATGSIGNYNYILSKLGAYYGTFHLRYRSNNKFNFFIGLGASGANVQSDGSSTYTLTDWNHVVLTYDKTNIKLYVNGSEDFSQAETRDILYYDASSPYSGKDLTIGKGPFPDPAEGLIDEVSYFSSALSASDISAMYNGGTPTDISSLNPVSWWRMGENDSGSDGATIGTVTDQGSGGNDGTGTNGATYSSTTP